MSHHWRTHTWKYNLHKRYARIELIPRISINYGPLKILGLSWLWWAREYQLLKVRGTRKESRERVKKDVALWRSHFPKEGEKKPLETRIYWRRI